MRIVMKTLGLAVAAIASVALASGAQAAISDSPAVETSSDSAQKPVEQLDELDEVWVRGKSLSEVIEVAEDDFFVLYNKLNKDSQYDVHCGRMSLNNGSMIMVRKCVPGFIVYNYSNGLGQVSFGCNGGMVSGFSEGMSYSSFASGCSIGSAYGTSPPPSMAVPSAEQMLMAKGEAYGANIVKVVKSDPRLLEKVRSLDGLYKEMDMVQGQYVKVKGDRPPPQASRAKRKGAGPYVGPRRL
jgi:hypothetical protein